MKKKIVIAAGTGFIGKYLTTKYEALGYEVLIISRSAPHITWNDNAAILSALEGAELLINLAGKSVDCRYTEKNKAEIFRSRTETTKALGEAILLCTQPPALWINSSTATIYRHAEDRPMTEATGELGDDFSPQVAKAWEKSFSDFNLPHTRQVALRIAIVLGKDGGALVPLTNLAKIGLGGMQGNGKQMVSWVHIEDVFNVIQFVKKHQEIKGVYNVSAPNPLPNKDFMSALRRAVHRTIGLPAPAWLLSIGTFFLRTEPELVLKSRWVLPEKITQAGFKFKYEKLEEALGNLILGKDEIGIKTNKGK